MEHQEPPKTQEEDAHTQRLASLEDLVYAFVVVCAACIWPPRAHRQTRSEVQIVVDIDR